MTANGNPPVEDRGATEELGGSENKSHENHTPEGYANASDNNVDDAVTSDEKPRLRVVDMVDRATIEDYQEAGYETIPYLSMTAGSITDSWVAKRFAESPEAKQVAITKASRRLFIYNGRFWEETNLVDGLGNIAEVWAARCGEVADALHGEVEVRSPKTDKVEKVLPSVLLKRYEWQTNLGKLIPMIRRQPAIQVDDQAFDANGDLAVFANGTWDQKAQVLRESRPEDMMTKMIDCDLVLGHRDPLFEQLLQTWGGRGHEIEQFMKLRLAESLFFRRTDMRWVIIQGARDSGKSYFLNVWWKKFLGPLGTLFPKELLDGKDTENSTQFAKSRIGESTFLVADELGKAGQLSVTRLKELNPGAGAGIDGRDPGGKSREFRNEANVFIPTNHGITLVGEIDEAAEKRLAVVTPPVQFVKRPDPNNPAHRQMDGTLDGKIKANFTSVRMAAMAWAIEGAQELFTRYDDTFLHPNYWDVDVPQSIRDATVAFVGGNDALGHFIMETFQAGEWRLADHDEARYEATVDDVWRAYKAHRKDQAAGSHVGGLTQRNLLKELKIHPLLAHAKVVWTPKVNLRPRTRYNEAIGAGPYNSVQTRRMGQPGMFLGMRLAVPGFTGEPAGWPDSDPDAEVLTPPEFSIYMNDYIDDTPRHRQVHLSTTEYYQEQAAAYVAQHGSVLG